MLEAKFCVTLRQRHADPRLRHVWNITAPFPEDDNLFIHEIFPHFHLNLGYDFRPYHRQKARMQVKCIPA